MAFLKSGVNHGLKLQTTYGKSATEKVLPAEVLQLVWMICFVSVFFFFFYINLAETERNKAPYFNSSQRC